MNECESEQMTHKVIRFSQSSIRRCYFVSNFYRNGKICVLVIFPLSTNGEKKGLSRCMDRALFESNDEAIKNLKNWMVNNEKHEIYYSCSEIILTFLNVIIGLTNAYMYRKNKIDNARLKKSVDDKKQINVRRNTYHRNSVFVP